ncbi:hypothetical protein D9M68_516440 [compost metagenome]
MGVEVAPLEAGEPPHLLHKEPRDAHQPALVVAVEAGELRQISMVGRLDLLHILCREFLQPPLNEVPGVQHVDHQGDIGRAVGVVVKEPLHVPGRRPVVPPIDRLCDEIDVSLSRHLQVLHEVAQQHEVQLVARCQVDAVTRGGIQPQVYELANCV